MNRIVQRSCKFCGRFSAFPGDRCPHCHQPEASHFYICWLVLAFSFGALLALIFY